ncbi:MAG: hypothetical protein ACRD4P_12090 [Bryobacteraceae bacterium]
MFFRREKPRTFTFEQRVDDLRQQGFTIQKEGPGALASKNGCAALIEDGPDNRVHVKRIGVLFGNQIGVLSNHGYQMFLETPDKRLAPAQAAQLTALHEFTEDLKEALGLTSLYNTSLGTVSPRHMYDRVEERDEGEREPWKVKL